MFIILLAIVSCRFIYVRNAGIGTTTPGSKAGLDITCTTKNVLFSRILTLH